MTRAFYRTYARVCRLHVMREDGPFPGRSGECGTPAWTGIRSEPIVLDPMPAAPPAGLTWCPLCVGRLAERRGRTGEFAAALAAE